MKYYILYLILYLFGSFTSFVFAQDIPGVVYLKMKPDAKAPPEFKSDIAINSMDIQAPWKHWIQEFQIIEIMKPFKTPDAELQKIFRIQFEAKERVHSLLELLKNSQDIQYAESGQYYKTFFTPDDVDARQDWYFQMIQAYDAWDIRMGDASVKLAIVDDAVKTDHPDLSPVLWVNPGEIPNNGIDDDGNGFIDDVQGYDVADDDNNPSPPNSGLWQLLGLFTHGTHCAGIAGAATNNGIGIASIGGGMSIIPVKATSNNSLIPLALDRANEGVDYAVAAGANVISMSWGGASQDSTLSNVIQAAVNAGCILVSAAGNDGNTTPNYPSALPGVICVGSVSRGDIISGFSQRGSMIDVLAPGDSIWSAITGTSVYGFQSGTSMACPMVAGLCGLMLSHNPNLNAVEIESCLKSSCDDISPLNPGLTGQMGAGRINAFQALNCLAPASVNSFTKSEEDSVYPNPGADILNIPGGSGQCKLFIYDVWGRVVYADVFQATVSVRDWPEGMYSIQILFQDGHVRRQSWLKLNQP